MDSHQDVLAPGAEAPASTTQPIGFSILELILLLALMQLWLLGASLLDQTFLGALSVVPPVIVGILLMRRRRQPLSDIGIIKPPRWGRFALAVLGTLVGTMFFAAVVNSVAASLLETDSNLEVFSDVEGNVSMLLYLLLISWTSAGIGEELLFRGIVMHKLERMIGSKVWQLAIVVLAQATLFGLAHAYQGVVGIISTGAIGLALGSFYYVFKRNIWVCVLTHALNNTIGVIMLYSGAIST
ncbi:MAG: CPBP family intramembrane glutamic endopeptidase [Planctomycetota bacterium]|jgi:membrane protease YdiL (CAAX protease family)